MAADEAEVQRQISDMLSREPRPAMPDHVRARIEAALHEEQQHAATRQGRRRSWVLPLGAAAGVAVLAGAVLLPQFNSSPGPTPVAAAQCQVTVDPQTDLSPVTHSTGTTYTQAGFLAETSELLSTRPGCQGEPAAAVDAETVGSRASADPTLSNCLFKVIPGQSVVAVDRATYRGEDVLVTVIAAAPRRALVVDCSPPPPTVMYDTQIP